MKSMKRRDAEQALLSNGCTVRSQDGIHTKWACPCGKHSANVPRHREVTAGVVRDTVRRMECLPKGWLQ